MDLWKLEEFRRALPLGVSIAIALFCVAVAVAASGRRRPLPLGGIAIAGGGLCAIAENQHVPLAAVLGVVGIGGAGALSQLHRVSRWLCFALAVPFALIMSLDGELVSGLWLRVLVTLAASGGALLAAEFDDTWRGEAPGLTLFVISVLGVYAAVPDTELVAALLGVALPVVLLGWPARLITLGRPGAAASVALLMWAGAFEGVGRPASIVAVVACLGLVVGTPVGAILLPRAGELLRRLPRTPLVLGLVLSHLVIVLAASRIAGPLSEPAEAALVGVAIGAAAVLTGSVFRPPARAVATSRVD
jgi:hypothetical protein